MATMTTSQRVRWDRAKDRAEEAIDGAIYDLEQTFKYCAPREAFAPEAFAPEGKQEECEALAADCLAEAIGCLHGAMSRLAAASDHIDWERAKRIREWPTVARRALEANRAALPAEVIALLDDKEIAP
jgi:hypothetical protein